MEEWYYNDFVMEKCTLDLKILAWKKNILTLPNA